MAAAANRNLQPSIASESQRGEDVGGAGATGDEGGTSADRPIPDRADLFVAFIERAEQQSGKTLSELLNRGVQGDVDHSGNAILPSVIATTQQPDALKIAVRYT
jgi:hypothetical protein